MDFLWMFIKVLFFCIINTGFIVDCVAHCTIILLSTQRLAVNMEIELVVFVAAVVCFV